ncbi:cytochrome P450 [Halobacteriales archaeon QH_10_67_22]|nr:MAG: cytochrome P450 [Halobacteriales archaeon QH_10_67_22]
MSETPPGPKGEPLFGASRQYSRDPFDFIETLESAYGDVAHFDMGPMETYMLTDPADIERVLVSEADVFRKPDFQNDALGDLLGDGLLLGEGETWKQQRQLANPAFSMARLGGMADRVTDHAEAMVDDWAAGDRIDAESEMARVTLNVILDLMLGVELPAEKIDVIEEQLEPLGQRFEPDPLRFAMPEWVPMPGDQEFETAVSRLEDVLDDIVAARRGTVGDAVTDDGPMDFLSVLIRARDRGEQSDQQLRDEMMTMLLAGHDTTALTLTYTWYLLSEHPAAEHRVQREVDDIVGDDRPGMEHVREFEYLEWVINESMRLYPPVFTVFREPTEAVELGGYDVPDGSTLMIPQWGVHRSERYWDDPETFDPERFSPERRADRPRFAFFPFGGGPRHCIGKHLSLLEAKIIVATVVSEYELDFEGESPLELLPSLTMHPRQEMTMTVRER